MKSIEDRRTELTSRRAELVERMEEVEEDLDRETTPDWEDLATAREDDEVLEGLGLSAQQEVLRIDAALARIDAGTYGDCVTCGAEISEERLDLLPFTPFCRRCAR